jgi:hypothetical protein
LNLVGRGSICRRYKGLGTPTLQGLKLAHGDLSSNIKLASINNSSSSSSIDLRPADNKHTSVNLCPRDLPKGTGTWDLIQSPAYKEAKTHEEKKNPFIDSPGSLIPQCCSALVNHRKHFKR